MGASEEASKTAQTVVEALKSTPLMLAIVVFNVLYMVGTFWSTHEAGERWERVVKLALENCTTQETTLTPTPKP